MDPTLWGVKYVTRLLLAPARRMIERLRILVVVYIKNVDKTFRINNYTKKIEFYLKSSNSNDSTARNTPALQLFRINEVALYFSMLFLYDL